MRRKRKATEKDLEFVRQWRKDNAEYVKQKKAETYQANKEEVKAKARAYRAANKKKIAAASAAKYQRDKDKINTFKRAKYAKDPTKMQASNKKWGMNNRGFTTAMSAAYHACKLQRKPEWLNKAQITEIRNFYRRSRAKTLRTGIQHSVDHIVPLQGKRVSGLHVPWNLQIITKSENSQKHNKH